MKRRTLKNLLSFLLVLVLTIGTVAALSMVTQAKTDSASAQYAQELQKEQGKDVAELSAAIPEPEETSPLASIGAFVLLLSIPTAGLLMFQKARRRGRDYREHGGNRRYSPKADMAFQGALSAKSRV